MIQKCRRDLGGISHFALLLFFSILALLIGDAAAGLASRLARSLALAATAVLRAVAKVAGLKRLDMLHFRTSESLVCYHYSIKDEKCQVSRGGNPKKTKKA